MPRADCTDCVRDASKALCLQGARSVRGNWHNSRADRCAHPVFIGELNNTNGCAKRLRQALGDLRFEQGKNGHSGP